MKKLFLVSTLVMAFGVANAKGTAGHSFLAPQNTDDRSMISGSVNCSTNAALCAAILGQLSDPLFSGWIGGCLVIGGTPQYCILR